MKELRYSSYANMALCYLKLEDYENVIDYCNKVIQYDPNNVKCLYRRGISYYFSVYNYNFRMKFHIL